MHSAPPEGDCRIAVTGIGLVTALGLSAPETWERSSKGESGIGPLRRLQDSEAHCLSSAEVPRFELADRLRHPKNVKYMNEGVSFAMRASQEAVAMSGLDLSRADAERVSLHVGSGQTGVDAGDFLPTMAIAWEGKEPDFKYLGGRVSRNLDPYFSLRTLSNAGIALLSAELGVRGTSNNFVQGDTASVEALAASCDELRDERSDVAIAGGYDSLLYFSNYLAYDKAVLLSPSDPSDSYRPFDQTRDGLVLGEGAAVLVLERMDDAKMRGARILGEIVRIASTIDPADSAQPKKSAAAFQVALDQAVGNDRVDFVVAHGIGTADGDRDEAELLASRFDRRTPITAFKSQTGYLGAATGAVEVALALLALQCRIIPPIARHRVPLSGCDLDFVARQRRRITAPAASALSLAWSWTGQCTAVLVRSLGE